MQLENKCVGRWVNEDVGGRDEEELRTGGQNELGEMSQLVVGTPTLFTLAK